MSLCAYLACPELSPNKSSSTILLFVLMLSTSVLLVLRLVCSGQLEGDKIRSIFCSMVWFMEEATAFPLGALIVKTPSELIVEVTLSA